MLWRQSKTSLPAGQARCRDCRAADRQRECLRCGTAFTTRFHTNTGELQRYCSISCANKVQQARFADHVSARLRKCEICSETYTRSYHKQRTCGLKCGTVLRGRTPRPPRPRKPRYPASKVLYLTCQGCDAAFTAARRRSLCDGSCYNAYRRRTHIPKQPADRPVIRRTCPECHREFETTHSVRRYCSNGCSSRGRRHDRSRARRAGVAYEPISRLRVYERDGWRCGICKDKVDPRLSYPDDWSVSLDHVVPMSLGGGHLYVNVQCAHLKCNVDKGAKGVGDQLVLVG